MTQVILNLSGLNRIEANLESRVDALLKTLAFTCEAEAKNHMSPESPSSPGNPPGIDTGNLINNIVTEKEDNGYAVYSNADYSVHLEYGTKNMAARPFMLPAFERTVERVAPKDLREVVE